MCRDHVLEGHEPGLGDFDEAREHGIPNDREAYIRTLVKGERIPNAKKFIKELTLEYNKLRQAAITAELLEITTAMRAME